MALRTYPISWVGRRGLNVETDSFTETNLGSAGNMAVDHPTVNLQQDIDAGFDHIRYQIRSNWLLNALPSLTTMNKRWLYIKAEIDRFLSTGATVSLVNAPNLYHGDPMWDVDMIQSDYPSGKKWLAYESMTEFLGHVLRPYGPQVSFQLCNEWRGTISNLMPKTQRLIDAFRQGGANRQTTLILNSDGTGSMDNIERFDWNSLNHRQGNSIFSCFAYNFQFFTHQKTDPGTLFYPLDGLHYPPDSSQRAAQKALIDADPYLSAGDKSLSKTLLDLYFDIPANRTYLDGKSAQLTAFRSSRPTCPPVYVAEFGCNTFHSGKVSAQNWFTDIRLSFEENANVMGWGIWSRGPDSYFDLRALPSKAFDSSYYASLGVGP